MQSEDKEKIIIPTWADPVGYFPKGGMEPNVKDIIEFSIVQATGLISAIEIAPVPGRWEVLTLSRENIEVLKTLTKEQRIQFQRDLDALIAGYR